MLCRDEAQLAAVRAAAGEVAVLYDLRRAPSSGGTRAGRRSSRGGRSSEAAGAGEALRVVVYAPTHTAYVSSHSPNTLASPFFFHLFPRGLVPARRCRTRRT